MGDAIESAKNLPPKIAEGPEKKYYIEDIEASRDQYGERPTLTVEYSQDKKSYLVDGKEISNDRARRLFVNCRNLDARDKKRLGL